MSVCVCVCEIVITAGLIHEAYVTIIMRLVNGPWLINKFYTEGRTKIENKEQGAKSTKQKHEKRNTNPKKIYEKETGHYKHIQLLAEYDYFHGKYMCVCI